MSIYIPEGENKIKIVDGTMIEYTIYDLVDEYNPILKQKTQEFDFENPQTDAKSLAVSLSETMGKKKGIGLSSNQVGISLRVFSMALVEGTEYDRSDSLKTICLFNPKVVSVSKHTEKYKEGCLTFPGLFLEIERPAEVDVEYQTFNGNKFLGRFRGIDARCVLHEIEHLDGKLYTEKFKPLALQMAKKKAKKINKL